MGNRDSFGPRKFYNEQIDRIIDLLEKHVKSPQIDLDKYLRICEELGQEPDPNKMPMDLAEMPYEVQLAFFVYSFLPDRWEGMSGSYLGKDWSSVGEVFQVYEIEEQKVVFTLCKHLERFNIEKAAADAEKRRKRTESKGKNYTHKVSG